ncbi:alanine and glycine-rich protein-like [Schistocerca nitens]|uniref:alanine and glycine-rich protein-like n=1 Tax=Schistocerca nitens TaxID=7011 RepID=UPI0021196D26|nr:alanine and glycine-rich protein-like [Schistocerca nitens]
MSHAVLGGSPEQYWPGAGRSQPDGVDTSGACSVASPLRDTASEATVCTEARLADGATVARPPLAGTAVGGGAGAGAASEGKRQVGQFNYGRGQLAVPAARVRGGGGGGGGGGRGESGPAAVIYFMQDRSTKRKIRPPISQLKLTPTPPPAPHHHPPPPPAQTLFDIVKEGSTER